jgi:hypothetical protein
VVFDNAASGFGTATSCSFNMAIGSGPNRAIGIGLAMAGTTATAISVKVGGTAATLVPGTDSGASVTYRTLMYALANPASGSQTVSVTWTGSMSAVCGAVSVTEADQTTPMNNGTFASNALNSAGTCPVTVTSTSGDLTMDTCTSTSGSMPTLPTQTSKWTNKDTTNYLIGAGGSIGPGTGTTIHNWTVGTWNQNVSSGANFKHQ